MTAEPPATPKPRKPINPRLVNPKSQDGFDRSAAALRANLAKRKAQTRARAVPDGDDRASGEAADVGESGPGSARGPKP